MKLHERNLKAFKDLQAKGIKALAEAMKADYGVDILSEKDGVKLYDLESSDFSAKGFREGAYDVSRKLKERNSEGTMGQLLRAGIQMTANNWYQAVEATYNKWIQETTSNKRQEMYAPLNRAGMPKRTGKSETFKEIDVKGLDVELVNYKFGSIIGFEKELFDDDQTGQIATRAGQMGENMRIYEDAYAYLRLLGAAGEISGDPVPASPAYGGMSGLFKTSAAPHEGGGFNRPVTFQRLGKQSLQDAFITLRKMKDLLGNKMLVMPDTIIVSPDDQFDLDVLLNSTMYPTAPGTAGTTGNVAAKNPLQGIATPVVSLWMPDKAWVLMQAGKGIIFQRREATEIVQENPASGPAFSADEYRYKVRARFEADWIDPRFAYLGNDGTV